MCCALVLVPFAAAGGVVLGVLLPRQDALLAFASNALGQGAAALAGSAPAAFLVSGLGWIGLALALLALGTALWVFALYALLAADADVSLLLRGRHRAGAFAGKVVWITGASQGLGEVLARYLAAQGARLILSSRSADKLQRVKDACKADPDAVVVLPLDLLAAPDKLAAAAEAADGAFGGAGVDYLIHMAGASQHALASETSAEVAAALLELNALAPIRLTQAALPHMLRRRRGRVVAVASMAAKVPSPGQSVYAAAKAATVGYFSSLATEVADQGVGVTICCPGPVATGAPDAPRCIYGPRGLLHKQEAPDSRRMDPARAALLICNAMAAGVAECWLAKQPVLTMAYLMQYVPQLGLRIMLSVGPRRARAIASGRSGYDVRGLLQQGEGT